MRTTLPTAHGGVVHLFVVYGYQGAEEDADQLQLTDKLLQAVLAEAQVVCVGQPMLIAGDFNADPAVIPVFLRVFLLDGMLIWLLLILSVLVLLLMLLVGLVGGWHWFPSGFLCRMSRCSCCFSGLLCH